MEHLLKSTGRHSTASSKILSLRSQNKAASKDKASQKIVLGKNKENLNTSLNVFKENRKFPKTTLEENSSEGCKLTTNRTMCLRQQKEKKSYAESSSSSCLESTFHNGFINSPRSTSCKGYSRHYVNIQKTPSKIPSLTNIEELETDTSDTKKTCVYKSTGSELGKSVSDMLPEEKLKLYDFEIDCNEPKTKKRKRKPRKRKVEVKFESDNDSIVSSVSKKMSVLSTKSLPTCTQDIFARKNLTVKKLRGASHIVADMETVGNHERKLETANLTPIFPTSSKSARTPLTSVMHTSQAEDAQPLKQGSRLIKCSKDMSTASNQSLLVSNLQLNIPSSFSPLQQVYSTPYNISADPNSSQLFEKNLSVPSPLQIKRNFPDHSKITLRRKMLNDTSTKYNFEPLHSETLMLRRNPENLNKKQNKILSSKEQEDNTSVVTNVTNSGYASSSFLNTPLQDYVTVRRMFHQGASTPTVPIAPENEKDLNLDNCFGFDADYEDELTSVKPVSAVSLRASSTPVALYSATRPRRFQAKNMRKVTSPRITETRDHPVSTSSTNVPDSVSDSISDLYVKDAANENVSHILFLEPNDLKPVSFVDESLQSHFNQPPRRSYERIVRQKRYSEEVMSDEDLQTDAKATVFPAKTRKKIKVYNKKERQAGNDWMAAMSAQFAEIEEVRLCVE